MGIQEPNSGSRSSQELQGTLGGWSRAGIRIRAGLDPGFWGGIWGRVGSGSAGQDGVGIRAGLDLEFWVGIGAGLGVLSFGLGLGQDWIQVSRSGLGWD